MQHSIQKILMAFWAISLMITTGCSVVHKTWLLDSEITEIVVLNPVYDPNQSDFFYSRLLQDIVYQMVNSSPEDSIRIINADWLINHQKIFEIWKILDQNQQLGPLDFDNEFIYEQLEPFEIFKKDRVLLLRIGLDDSGEKTLILDGYRLVKVAEEAVDINYFNTPISVKDLSGSLKTAVYNLLSSMKYASPDFLSLGFEKVKGGCYQNKLGEEECLEDFFISRYPVTEKQWQLIMDQRVTKETKDQAGEEIQPQYPKTNVSWNQIQMFLERLNDIANGNYVLPTGSEWEYTCLKLGKNSLGNFLGKRGADKWLSIAPVNAFPMEHISIADLPGNTWEWTNDVYTDPEKNAVFQWLDGFGKTPSMVLKGGSFDSPDSPNNCLMEMKLNPNISMIDIGFRLVWKPE